jgi:soluble lytic murein transglycosylase-like protein
MTDQVVDKFVWQYIVETRDSLKKIEDFQKKQNEVEKSSKKQSSSMKELGNSLRTLASEAGGAGEAAIGLGEALTTLGAAAGPIAAVIGVVMLLKKTLQETKATMSDLLNQRDLGARIGLSGVSVENITRNLRRVPGSQIDQRGVNDILEKIGTKLQSAYIDPAQMNADAIQLRQAGVSINGKNGGINTTVGALDELQAKFKSVSEEQARGIGRVLGLTNQQVDAMRNLETTLNDTTHMTAAETAARIAAQQKTEELVSAENDLSDHWRTLKEDLLVHVIPAIDLIVKALDGLVQIGEKVGGSISGAASHVWSFAKNHVENFKRTSTELLHGDFKSFFGDVAREWNQSGDTIHSSAKSMMKTADDQAQATTTAQTELQRIINMFSQSVTQFSNSIDERQAWAAWAGEIGRAGGLGSSGNKSLGMTGTGGNTAAFNEAAQTAAQYGLTATAVGSSAKDVHDYDAIFQMAAAKTGLPADLLKRVAMAESSLIPTAKSSAGARGLMGIMPSNFKAYGITNPDDPTQSIMAGAQILAANYKRYGNIDDALRAYNGGTDKSRWGKTKENAEYVGRIAAQNATINGEDFSANPDLQNNLLSSWGKLAYDPKATPLFNFNGSRLVDPRKGGESREKSQLLNLQQQLAAQLGVPVSQLQTGNVSRGDVDWAASNMMANLVNSRYTLLNQMNVPGLTSMAKAGLYSQLKTTDTNIQSMMRYMPNIDQSAMPGDRNITIGTGAVQVIVQGANVTPEQLAKEINSTLADHLNEVINHNASAVAN